MRKPPNKLFFLQFIVLCFFVTVFTEHAFASCDKSWFSETSKENKTCWSISKNGESIVNLSHSSIGLLTKRLQSQGFNESSDLLPAVKAIDDAFKRNNVDHGYYIQNSDRCTLYSLDDPARDFATIGTGEHCKDLKTRISVAVTEYMDDIVHMTALSIDPSKFDNHRKYLNTTFSPQDPKYTALFLAYHDIDYDNISKELALASRLKMVNFSQIKLALQIGAQPLERENTFLRDQVASLHSQQDAHKTQLSEAAVTAERCVADVSELGEHLVGALDHLEELEQELAQAKGSKSNIQCSPVHWAISN